MKIFRNFPEVFYTSKVVLILFRNQGFKPYIIIIMITINNKYFPNPINLTLRMYCPHSERTYEYVDDYESLKMLIGYDMTTRVLSILYDAPFGKFSDKIAMSKSDITYIAFFYIDGDNIICHTSSTVFESLLWKYFDEKKRIMVGLRDVIKCVGCCWQFINGAYKISYESLWDESLKGSEKCDTIMVYENYIKILFASGSIRLIGLGSCGFTIGKAT